MSYSKGHPSALVAHFFPGKSQSFIWHFLLFLLPVSIVLIIGISLHYSFHVKANLETLEKTDLLNVRLAQLTVNNVLHDIVSDIKYLQEHNQLRNGFIKTPRARKILEQDFLSFSKNRKIYDQIRYLDLNGKEIVRVNDNNGQPYAVDIDQLQQKDSRYYVANTLALERNDIYWSPFDLNMENHKIEEPYKPTIRIGTPVYSSYGRKTGVLILNFDGKKLINEFRRATANIANHIMLLNESGYWLIHPQSKNEWGFMFSNPTTFASQHPQLWQEVSHNNRTTQQYIDNSLLTYATIFFNAIGTNNTPAGKEKNTLNSKNKSLWKIIAFAPSELINQSHADFFQRNALFYGIIFILIAIGAFLLARLQIYNQKSEAQGEYERSFRNILESMDLLAITLDRDAKVIFCNHSFLNLSGYKLDDIINCNWFEKFVDPNERAERKERFTQTFVSGISGGHREGEVIIKNGSKRLIGSSSTLSYDSNNIPVSITFIGTDITEQRYTENELRKASQAIEQSPNTVLITDTEGHIVYSNPKFTELTGYTKEEVLGENPKILQSGETDKNDYKNLWSALKNGKEWIGEFHNKKKNGELYWESARISAIKDTDGNITHFLAVKEDITEKKLLAEEVKLRNDEIAKNELLAGVGKMANMIAHDLRNPLSSIKMGMQILHGLPDKPIGEEGKELIDIGLEQVQYMESILTDLLSFSRPEQLNLEWISIEKLLDTSLVSVQSQIEKNTVTINTDYQTGLPTIHADKTKMRQVFSNLISNALQALKTQDDQEPVISISSFISMTDLGPMLEVQIADNGIGIDKETQKKLFEPFFTTRAKGTGLGLAIVKRIIDQHKGFIRVNSEPFSGTTMSIILPISLA
ncbi:MAG: PAS domain-containing sensor histidine kinase [Gammaproteobacteria bacterium]|nr:MAG: PAS domain-containing sensor histidine kinase [Gammaproteobacteria bacterium]